MYHVRVDEVKKSTVNFLIDTDVLSKTENKTKSYLQ